VGPAEMACGLHFCAGMVAAIPCMNVRAEQALLYRIEGDLNLARLPPLLWYDVLLELVREPGERLRHRDLLRRMLLAKYNRQR